MPGARRPNHKTAHATCPFGKTNWADCDEAAAHQWGRCIAITGDREPTPCTRWAMDPDGYCFQHFASRMEAAKREEKAKVEAERRERAITAFLALTAACPSLHECPHRGPNGKRLHKKVRLTTQAESTRGLAGLPPDYHDAKMGKVAAGGGLEPPTSRVTVGRSTTELPRKGPHRLTELA